MPDQDTNPGAIACSGDDGRAAVAPAPLLSLGEALLIEELHGGFPLVEQPFAEVGARLGMGEAQVIERLHRLLARGLLTRFGPLFQIERAGGQFVLAAMEVPAGDFDAVARVLHAMPEVAHNYRREHRLNMWFVVAAETPEGAQAALGRIAYATALRVWAFPKEREYHVELRLPMRGAAGAGDVAFPKPAPARVRTDTRPLTPFERALVAATQTGLPLVERPYEAVGAAVGADDATVRAVMADMLARGLIRRIGAVPHHVKLGFVANGMSVWDVDDARVDDLGEAIGQLPGVSHCYRRPRREGWPYNLFAMLHGRSREAVHAQARVLAEVLGPACRGHDILFSSAVLKKTGLRLHPRRTQET
ncbi:siroheme decarboxylase subunit beta [Azohydromonas aeria]|uniref:siroheme decarboxylase subunit beta n=1 Tax=Azohydromonas aeria TaxID=2590212 RepID=UPI001E54061E|nr:Lrp/AsnC family transcriptional regulator [Azohydromonas aeria]